MFKKLISLVILLLLAVRVMGAESLSIVQLIVNPKQYNGWQVYVYGYVTSSGGAGLTLSKEYASDSPSVINLSIVDELVPKFLPCINHYVNIRGKFVVDETGNMFIEDITSIDGGC